MHCANENELSKEELVKVAVVKAPKRPETLTPMTVLTLN